jgi:hypothetical protein
MLYFTPDMNLDPFSGSGKHPSQRLMPRFHFPALLILAASWAYGASVGDIPHLPFGIDAQTPLEKVVVTLDFSSAKTGAGTQRITLRGEGTVRLDFARSSQDKQPKSLERNCGP